MLLLDNVSSKLSDSMATNRVSDGMATDRVSGSMATDRVSGSMATDRVSGSMADPVRSEKKGWPSKPHKVSRRQGGVI